MAIYHLTVKNISRGKGHSAVAAAAYRAGDKLRHTAVEAAAYRSGEKLHDKGKTHNYTRKSGIAYTEIMLPNHAPRELENRQILWNTVELSEKRVDARTAREVEVSLPREFSLQEQIEVVRAFIQENFVDKGMCADFAIHHKDADKPHAHIMLTTRNLSMSGFGNKNRDWNKVECLQEWRKDWSDVCNKKLQEKGLDDRIDHRTLKAQGIDREPTIPEGRNPEKINYNQEVRRRNAIRAQKAVAERLDKLIKEYSRLDDKIATAKTEHAEKNQETRYLSAKIERMDEQAENIKTQDMRLDNLRAERQSMGILKSKREIDNLIERQEQSCQAARNHFKHKFHIDPEQTPIELARLGVELKKWEQHTIPDLAPLIDMHKEIEQEYKRVHLAVESRPDRQDVLDYMERLKMSQSVKKQVEYTRIERKLHTKEPARTRDFDRGR